MQKLNMVLFSTLLSLSLSAKESEEHTHSEKNNIKLNYENADFVHSKKKEDGQRYGIEIDHEDEKNHFQFYYEKTKTNTTEIVPEDLDVNKYTVKYQYKFSPKNRLTLSYATIDDNIMKEVDGGNIYGIGYVRKGFEVMQYMSDYKNFDVYQSDLKYGFKKGEIKMALIGKYIHLKDKDSNDFSKNAKDNYFTGGIKIHTHKNGYHLGAGAFFGKRAFAVMKDGFKVQHHAMEFKESYMVGIGHDLSKNMATHLRYGHHEAKEIPINNDNVKIENISLDFIYKF